MAANIAPIKWAQRVDTIYLTISLPDASETVLNLTANKLEFSGVSGGKKYSLDCEFFKEIDTEGSIWNVLPSSIQMKLNKKEKGESFWPRLLLDKNQEKTNVKVDWDRYVDEDEADEDFDTKNLDGGMDFGGMGGMGGMMGGMGGMGGMMGGMGGGDWGGAGGMGDFGGDDDSDDADDLPDLEAAV